MTQTFKDLNISTDIINNSAQTVTSPLWSNGVSTYTTYFTSSLLNSTQKQYYYEIVNSTSSNADAQMAVTYGHRLGSGSYSGGGSTNDSPTRAIYSQYKNLLLSPTDTQFSFYGNFISDSIYVISVNRARLKERLNSGTWQLNLAELNGNSFSNSVYTGSNVQVSSSNRVVSLIDDSQYTTNADTSNGGRVYNIVSGSISTGIFGGTISSANTYGQVYPDLGLIVLNANSLNTYLKFNSVTSSFTTTGSSLIPGGDNAWKLYTSISGAAAINSSLGFTARNEETVKSKIIFVRAFNNEFNFSTNPTFVTGSDNRLAQPTMNGNPKVYVTTVGLYDSNYNLVAVAKLSKPLLKSFEREISIRVKLDF